MRNQLIRIANIKALTDHVRKKAITEAIEALAPRSTKLVMRADNSLRCGDYIEGHNAGYDLAEGIMRARVAALKEREGLE